MRVLKPRVVDIDLCLMEELLREEYMLEKKRYGRMLGGGEADSRR